MSKPLELVIYDEYHGSYSRRQLIDGVMHLSFHTPTDAKRFTEAELAAAHWKARALGWPVLNADTIHRFAALPHYDEVPA